MTFDPVSIGSLVLSGVVLGSLLRYRAQTFAELKRRDEAYEALDEKRGNEIQALQESSRDCERRYGELKGYVDGVRAASTDAVVAVVRESFRPKTGAHHLPEDLQEYLEAARARASREDADTPVEIPNPRRRDGT